jgi:succinate dehydrogenase hydrophobic anchor subunit
MSPAARSVSYFGFYLYFVGVLLIAFPDFLLSTMQLPATNEVWIRVVGVLAFCIGYYYHRAGIENITTFFKHTIPTRLFIFINFVMFVVLGYVSPILIIFGAADLAGAVWTWIALSKEK